MKNQNEPRMYLLFITALVLLAGALFLNLGVAPLRLEEPRRAMIALEMIFNKNYIVPTEFGEFYYNKPPLWNWVIVLAYKIFGDYSEFAVRLFSTLSYLATGVLLFLMGRKHVNPLFGVLSSLFFLVSVDTLFYFSLLGEIDLFHAMLLSASFFSLFHFYTIDKKLTAYLLFYFFCALAALTKGLPSMLFAAATAAAFAFLNRKIRELFSFQHLAGVAVFLFLVGGYFYLYAQQHHVSSLAQILFDESAKRTLINSSGSLVLFRHVIIYPGELLVNTLPVSLFSLALIDRTIRKSFLENRYLQVCAWIFLLNFLVYWISPGAKQRYIYMLYPLAVNIFVFAFLHSCDKGFIEKVIHIFFVFLFFLVIAGFVSLPFWKELEMIERRGVISIGASVFSALLLFLYLRHKQYRPWPIIFLFILLRYAFDITVLPSRAQHSAAASMKRHGEAVAALSMGRDLFLFGETACPRAVGFYIERTRLETLKRNRVIQPGSFYILDANNGPEFTYDTVYRFEHRANNLILARTH